jgi:hypothetical protein
VAALTLTVRWPVNVRVASAPAPIQGMIVDPSVLKAEQQRKDQEVQRKQREERDKQAAEQKQREKEAADKRERDRLAEQQRAKEQADREKAEAAKVAQEKAAKEKAAQEAREKQAREDAARKQKEAAKQKQLDAETQREAAQEAARMEAERSGVMDDYIRQIQNQIARNWNQPLSAKPGLECVSGSCSCRPGTLSTRRSTILIAMATKPSSGPSRPRCRKRRRCRSRRPRPCSIGT